MKKKALFLIFILPILIFSDGFIVDNIKEKKEEIKKEEIKLPKIYKEQEFSEQLKYLKKNMKKNNTFELAAYFGLLIKDNPKYKDDFLKVFKYSTNKKIPAYAFLIAKIEKPRFRESRKMKLINPLTFKKYYKGDLDVLIGYYKYYRTNNYLDVIYKLINNQDNDFIKENTIKLLSDEYSEARTFFENKKQKKIIIKKDPNEIEKDEFINMEK